MSRTSDTFGPSRVYPTKVDWWIGAILIVTVAIMLGSTVPFFVGPLAGDPVAILVGTLLVGTAVWIARIPFNTTYEITGSELVVRSAWLRWRIPLDTIQGITPTHNPLSAPACSLDRLRIDYRSRRGHKRFLMISPREKEAFVETLQEALPKPSN